MVTAGLGFGVTGGGVATTGVVTGVVVASGAEEVSVPKEMIVEDAVGITDIAAGSAGVKNEPTYTAAVPTVPGT